MWAAIKSCGNLLLDVKRPGTAADNCLWGATMKKTILAICLVTLSVPTIVSAEGTPKSSDHTTQSPNPSPERTAELLKRRVDLTKKAKGGEANSIVDLASSLEMPDGVNPVDRDAAMDLYQKAADKGDRTGRQKTCLAYLLGEGRIESAATAMPYCNALGLKDRVGLFAIAYDYQTGLSGPKDEDMAMSLYVQAFQAGSGEAAAALGVKALSLGKLETARQWFKRGAYLGSADAIDHLAVMVEAGDGGVKDELEARWLYASAADRGNVHATKRVEEWPDAKDPPSICAFSKTDNPTGITHTWSDAKGKHTEAINLHLFKKLMTDNFPADMRGSQVAGDTRVNCYIGADHVIDVCVVRQEFPIGYGIAASVQAFFNGQVTVANEDADGTDTANKILDLGVNFKIG
jgi:TPR repeat protein